MSEEIKSKSQVRRLAVQNPDTLYLEIDRLRKELEEQCRLNGMGSEREAKLMAQLSEAVRVIKFCQNANPHPDLSWGKYNDAYQWIEEKTTSLL